MIPLLALLAAPAQAAGAMSPQIAAAPEVVWVGIDYSVVRMFVEQRFEDPDKQIFWGPGAGLLDVVRHFKDQKEAFTTLSEDWNAMAQNSLVVPLEKIIERDLVIDMPSPMGQTQTKRSTWFESVYEAKNNPPDLTPDGVAALVKKYKLDRHKGVAFVLIADRFDEPEKEACFWPTWFDPEKKGIIQTERVCEKASGSEFRNQWFSPVSRIMKAIVKTIKDGKY